MEIGDIIKNARKKLKLTQVDLAAMLNVSQDTISSYEKGKIKVIPFEKRVALSMILDINAEDLLYEQEKGQVSIDSVSKMKVAYDAFVAATLAKTLADAHNTGYIMGTIYKIFLSSENIDNANIENAFHELFSKRGLPNVDALALAKFFTWLCMEQPNVLSRWNDKMLREKMDASKK